MFRRLWESLPSRILRVLVNINEELWQDFDSGFEVLSRLCFLLPIVKCDHGNPSPCTIDRACGVYSVQHSDPSALCTNPSYVWHQLPNSNRVSRAWSHRVCTYMYVCANLICTRVLVTCSLNRTITIILALSLQLSRAGDVGLRRWNILEIRGRWSYLTSLKPFGNKSFSVCAITLLLHQLCTWRLRQLLRLAHVETWAPFPLQIILFARWELGLWDQQGEYGVGGVVSTCASL